ncbi:hypothetical protein [Demequina activiva]|uniref:Uncharacterized protein n=1 Tax=Demequina activiva TaxID=1582364 RepID=A0A919PZN0_9MICO|nr:hypothetical protein [Demequina activiva]GIG53314.1 hypothetical protein Dac01nite_00660 [Demequina activiva]
MTVAHPSVATLAPPSRERTRISHGKAAVSAARQNRFGAFTDSIAFGGRNLQPIAPTAPQAAPSAEVRARHAAQARIGLIATSTVMRTALAVALVVGMYLVISSGAIGIAGETFASWYAATVAPYMAVDLTPSVSDAGSPFGFAAGVPEMLQPVG